MAARQILFRVDASVEIGTGHIMRCLTLADVLRKGGARCLFLCRPHDGHLLDLIAARGHDAIALPLHDTSAPAFDPAAPAHAPWLGADWATDAADCYDALAGALACECVDWLVVDHYALDRRWEQAMRPHCRRLLVVDDLADRHHVCDILLDQNFVPDAQTRYTGKIPRYCLPLLGPSYALLRPEFETRRDASLRRRRFPILKTLLVCMGGADSDDETRKVVAGLIPSPRRWDRIDIVVGQHYPAREALHADIRDLHGARLHVQTPHMAQLMSEADFALTAGGSVTWEKCALGLPSATVVLADNQASIAAAMHEIGALHSLGPSRELNPGSYAEFLDSLDLSAMPSMSRCASELCGGGGAKIVADAMDKNS